MIYLYASSSNTISLMPSSSFEDGDSARLLFRNRFTEVTQSVDVSLDVYGKWVKSAVNIPNDISLKGGSYDLVLQKPGIDNPIVWGTANFLWDTIPYTWNNSVVLAAFSDDTTTTAFVSESISRTMYTSANENAAYVVYNG